MNANFIQSGTDGAPPLVFIHAFPLHKDMWRHQIEGLDDIARVYAPDTPGFGESPLLSAEPTMSAYVESLLNFLDEQKIEQACFCGCSMGGYILFELWRQMPRRVLGLILCDTRAESDSPEASRNRLQIAETVRSEGVGSLVEGMPAKLFGETSQSERTELVKEVRGWIQAANPEGVAQAQIAMSRRPDSIETLESIVAPTLIIVGEEDGLTPPSAAEAMHAAIPNSKLQVIARAGHLSPLESPDEVNRSIRSFFETAIR